MKLKRLIQLLITSFLGQLLSVFNQLLVPPLFLRSYGAGVEMYGEWIALSAAVNYLGTLNYGIQTYANNQMSILYNGGDLAGAKSVQASAFRLLLLLIAFFALAGLAVFALPVASWLRLRHVSEHDASLTLYLLVLQFAMQIVVSMLSNSYMVVGELHRGNYWNSGYRFFQVLAMCLLVLLHASFPLLAGSQLLLQGILFICLLVDMSRRAPILLPSLRYGSWKEVGKMLKPSGHFGLIAIASFLTWQMPVILIQRVLGPAALGVFALMRVIFQMVRQLLMTASVTIGQDITILFGQRDWKQLTRLYDLSERVILFLSPLATLGSMILCPLLFKVWLHKQFVYEPWLCILMAAVSAVIGIKEHKTQFQASSNQHEKIAFFIVPGYVLMLLASWLLMPRMGISGYLVCWLLWESIQTAYILHLNLSLMPAGHRISLRPVFHHLVYMLVLFCPAHGSFLLSKTGR